ncbi:MAG: DUF523 domain-containing protein [Epsilonproteobacteria bacterium]|nr:DUF523 domain-containing protein [Campylobacterota bacterium]
MQNLKPSDLNTKKTAIVSACLLGEYCRYDGKTKQDLHVKEFLKDYEIIPFCPEAPLFGTPRERINVVKVGDEERIITDETDIDVTERLKEWIEDFITQHKTPDLMVLKSKSPSCGFGTTPVLDQEKNILYFGNGIGADILHQTYNDVKIVDENSLE